MKKILKNIGYILLIILSIFTIFTSINNIFFKNNYPFKYKTAIILSGSMEPTLQIDDLVIVKKVDDVRVGDIVSFYDKDNKEIMHRIVEIDNDKVITKGDANNVKDEEITKDKITGIYVGKIKYVGKVIRFIKSPIGITLCFAIILSLLFIPTKKEEKENKEQEEKRNKIVKIVILTIGYILILALCIVAGFYSKYKVSVGGKDDTKVALLALSKSQVLQVNTVSLYPGEEIKYRFGIKNNKSISSEVTLGYQINVITTNNLPLTYSLKCLSKNNGVCLTGNDIEVNTSLKGGIMPYIDTTHEYELTIKWNLDNDDYDYANDLEIIKIKIDAEQID